MGSQNRKIKKLDDWKMKFYRLKITKVYPQYSYS